MNLKASIVFLLFGPNVFGQNKSVTYRNNTNAYYSSIAPKDAFFAPKVNEIILNSDSTFEFWSRPNVSCFIWNEYKGKWKITNDTISFYDNYEIVENDTRVNYKNVSKKSYRISFRTDRNSELKNTKKLVSNMFTTLMLI
jgi:hypothetical protein